MFKVSKKIGQWLDAVMVAYAAVAVIYQVLYLIAPVKAFVNLNGLDVLSSLLAVGGALLLAVDFFTQQWLFKARYSWVLVATLATLAISSVVHIRMGLANNVKVLIWQAVQMLLLYSVYKRLSAQQTRVFLQGMHTVFSVAFVPAAAVSLYHFFAQKGYELVVDHTGGVNRQGFLEGRLFGVFTSVHFVGVLLAVMIVGAVYFAVKTPRVWLKVLYVLESLLFFLYIVLSGTRSVFIAMALAAFAACFMLLKQHLSVIKKEWLTYMATVGISVVVAIAVIFSVQTVDTQFKKIPPYISEQIAQRTTTTTTTTATTTTTTTEQTTTSSTESTVGSTTAAETTTTATTTTTVPPTTTTVTTTTTKPVEMNRGDAQDDISNNRFKIWRDYLSITSGDVKSLLFGNSPGEYMNVIRENHPDAYIVTYIQNNYPNMFKQNLIYDTHNGYLAVFVTGGLLCVLVFGAFLVLFAIRVVKRVFSKKPLSASFVALLSALIIILIATFFDSDVFFKCTSTSMLFWLLLGFMAKATEEEKQDA